MSEQPTAAAQTAAPPPSHRQRPPRQRRAFASRLFGYDIFISFALGFSRRGTQSYASDLARQLRERDFSVFYSEDEAAPGEDLDDTLLRALLRSSILVVIANRGTLEAPRWVRTEVEAFRKHHPGRPIIPINIGGAMQDAALRLLKDLPQAPEKIICNKPDLLPDYGLPDYGRRQYLSYCS